MTRGDVVGRDDALQSERRRGRGRTPRGGVLPRVVMGWFGSPKSPRSPAGATSPSASPSRAKASAKKKSKAKSPPPRDNPYLKAVARVPDAPLPSLGADDVARTFSPEGLDDLRADLGAPRARASDPPRRPSVRRASTTPFARAARAIRPRPSSPHPPPAVAPRPSLPVHRPQRAKTGRRGSTRCGRSAPRSRRRPRATTPTPTPPQPTTTRPSRRRRFAATGSDASPPPPPRARSRSASPITSPSAVARRRTSSSRCRGAVGGEEEEEEGSTTTRACTTRWSRARWPSR